MKVKLKSKGILNKIVAQDNVEDLHNEEGTSKSQKVQRKNGSSALFGKKIYGKQYGAPSPKLGIAKSIMP